MTSLPCICEITESSIYRDQTSKQNEENWRRFFPAPRKTGVVSFTLKYAAHYFFFLTWEDWLGKGVQGHKFRFYELKN